jgi:hypothetical protein
MSGPLLSPDNLLRDNSSRDQQGHQEKLKGELIDDKQIRA